VKNLFGKIRSKLSQKKKTVVAMVTGAFMMAFVTGASAATPGADAAVVSSITDGFSGVQATAVAVIGAIAAVALVLFAAPYAWQYGKKIFKTVAR